MDIADESGGRRDAKSTLAAVTATSEARIRTLNNKVFCCCCCCWFRMTIRGGVQKTERSGAERGRGGVCGVVRFGCVCDRLGWDGAASTEESAAAILPLFLPLLR